MSALDDKINEHFQGLVVRKDLVKIVKGNAIVPTIEVTKACNQDVRPTVTC